MSAHAKISATTSSPYVTLEPPGPTGKQVSSGNDSSDFYALGAALLLIVAAIVVVRYLFRRHSTPVSGPR